MKTRNRVYLVMAIVILGLASGCSELSQTDDGQSGDLGINSPSATEGVPPPFVYEPYQFPEAASQPPPGRQIINLAMKVDNPNPSLSSNDNDFDICNPPDSIWAGKYVQEGQNKTIKLQKNELKLKSDCVPYPAWITMTKPVANEPWVEFEPHGMVFDLPQTVEVKLYYEDCVLPPGVEPEDLEVWYWNEELEVYEYIGGENNLSSQYIKFYLDHFSRYVVAAGA